MSTAGTNPDHDNLDVHYRAVLGHLFEGRNCDPLEYIAALLRMAGAEDAGWDTLLESERTLQDLTNFTGVELSAEKFPNPDHTRLRLRLLAYAHVVEMDAPYEIMANLCRVKAGLSSSILPFHDPAKLNVAPVPGKRSYLSIPISPAKKIAKIKQLSKMAGVPEVGTAFGHFYFSAIRNAVDHSDYIIHGEQFRVRKGQFLSEGPQPVPTQTIPIVRLQGIIDRAFAFYNAFFELERAARQWFSTMKGQAIPYDLQLKGLLEFLLDEDDLLCGFKVHWPNKSESIYRRTVDGSAPFNMRYGIDGVGVVVGEYHREHEPFSRLVEKGNLPEYTPLEGSVEPLQWPENEE